MEGLNRIAYPNRMTNYYQFPYDVCYYGDRQAVEGLHEWKQKIIAALQEFFDGCKKPSKNIMLAIDLKNENQRLFFLEQRKEVATLLRQMNCCMNCSDGYKGETVFYQINWGPNIQLMATFQRPKIQ